MFVYRISKKKAAVLGLCVLKSFHDIRHTIYDIRILVVSRLDVKRQLSFWNDRTDYKSGRLILWV